MMRLPYSIACAGLLLIMATGKPQGVTKPILTAAPTPPPATTQAPAAKSTTTPMIGPDYVIGPDDSISVTVWKEANLSGALTVRPDGMISIPLLGDVKAAGMTPMALSQDLTVRLKKYITDPLVTVTVMGVNSQRVFMVGEIGHVGPLTISSGMTMLQAIVTAGGPSPYANLKKIYILRGPQGSQKKIFFDYKKALKTGDQQGVTLQPGDTIVFP